MKGCHAFVFVVQLWSVAHLKQGRHKYTHPSDTFLEQTAAVSNRSSCSLSYMIQQELYTAAQRNQCDLGAQRFAGDLHPPGLVCVFLL